MRPHARQLEPVQHVDGLVADGLEARDRPVELHPHLGVLRRETERGVARADELGRKHDRRVVDDPPPQPGLVAARADRHRPALLEHETGRLARRVHGRNRLAARGLEQERAQPLLGTRDDDHPVRRVPVEHERLLAREHPVGALAPGAGVHAVDGIVVAELLERNRAPDRARRELREQVGVLEPASRERGEDR